MRKKIIAANWKMNGDKPNSEIIVQKFTEILGKSTAAEIIKNNISSADGSSNQEKIEVVFCPAYPYLNLVANSIQGNSENNEVQNFKLVLGAQNLHFEQNGAYTGEVSACMLQDLGCSYVIVGHSERRQYFSENNEIIAKKVKSAISNGLKPILCFGETKSERSDNKTFTVVTSQLEPIISRLNSNELADLVLAYEPVWAIGTGLTASPEEAEAVHVYVRDLVAKYDKSVARAIPILYGGSVKAKNAKSLFAMPNIDGGLVGGASLIPEEFSNICLSIT